MAQDRSKISELAYLIWESEGRPEDQAVRHWHMAAKAVETLGLLEVAAAMNAGSAADEELAATVEHATMLNAPDRSPKIKSA
jgi:hypothetical protein